MFGVYFKVVVIYLCIMFVSHGLAMVLIV